MAEQKNKKVEEKIDNTPIDGQVVINENGIAEIKAVEEPDGEIVEIDKESIAVKDKTNKSADYISRTKVLDVINSTMAKYNGKVILAMSEVRDIIKAITTAVNE